MMYLVFAVLGLHIISFPIVIGVTVYINTDENIGKIKIGLFAIPIFTKKINIERLKSKIFAQEETKSEKKQDNESKSSGFKLFLMDCARRIVTRIRVRNAELVANIGTGDAAVTAMAVGSICVLCEQACAFFCIDGKSAAITPDYGNECIFLDFFGIFSLCLADIIVSVCAALAAKLFRRTDKRRKYANTVAK